MNASPVAPVPVPASASASTAVVVAQALPTGLTEVQAPSAGQPTPPGVRSGRDRIDDLDARILSLIAERVETARSVQAARIAEGGRRLDLKRETEIIARYREALGRPGVAVAMAVLELCRGRV
jgi:chorismate mutase